MRMTHCLIHVLILKNKTMTIKPVHLDLASPKKIPCTQT